MPFKNDFFPVLIEFGRENGTKMVPKSDRQPIATSKGFFLKKHCFSLGKTMILKNLGVEVGTKNQPKIDQKMKSKMECLLASIFFRFS